MEGLSSPRHIGHYYRGVNFLGQVVRLVVVEVHGFSGLDIMADLFLVLLEEGIQHNVFPFFPSVTLLVRDVRAVPHSVASVGPLTPMCALSRGDVWCVN